MLFGLAVMLVLMVAYDPQGTLWLAELPVVAVLVVLPMALVCWGIQQFIRTLTRR
jgi:hypothetical protein